MSDLIERLTKPASWRATFHGGGSYSEREEAAPFEAAARIRELEAELAEVEGLLDEAGQYVCDASCADWSGASELFARLCDRDERLAALKAPR